MPTTVTKTVKSSGGDYSSATAWEAGTQGDLVSADEIQQGACYGMQDTAKLVVAGSTVDGTRYRRLYPASGAEAQMPYDTSGAAYRIEPTSLGGGEGAVTIQENSFRLERLQIKLTPASQDGSFSYWGVSLNNGSTGCRVIGCHIKADLSSWVAGSTKAYGFVEDRDLNGSNYVANNFFTGWDFATHANARGCYSPGHAYGSTPRTYFYNNTAVGCGYGFHCDAGDSNYAQVVSTNNLATGCTTGFGGLFHSSSDYNAAEDTSAPGTHSRNSQTFTFVGGSDYHLASGDAGAKGFGVDLSGDANYPFSDDFDGDTRGATWDIGADQYVSSGSSVNAQPGAGVGTLAGFAPAVQTPRNVLAGVGAGTLSGLAPTIQTPRNVLAGVGAGSFTGYAPSVTTSTGVVPGAGVATITGFAPTVQAPRNVQAATGALAVAGFAPLAGHTGLALPNVGAAIFTGFAPTIQTPRNVTPGVGSAILAGFAPLAGHTGLALPGAAAAIFAGFAPLVTGIAFGSPGPHPLRIAFDPLTKSIEFDTITKRLTIDPLTKTLDWEA